MNTVVHSQEPRQEQTYLQRVLAIVSSKQIAIAAVVACVVAVAFDVTSSKYVEAAIYVLAVIAIIFYGRAVSRQERERFDTILDAATEIALVATDMSGKITLFNKGAEAMLGYAAEEVVDAVSLDTFHDVHELAERAKLLDVDAGAETLLSPVRSGVPSTHEWTYVRKDGRRLTVTLAITALRHRAGKVVGYLGIAVDVTRQREQERERERLLWLERELTQQLVSQNDELVRMDRSKDEFVATVSHEFRTPLTSIKGYLETLLDGDAGPLTEKQQRFLRTVERNGERLALLIEDLLFAARIDAGGASVAVLAEVDMAEMVVEAVESATPHAANKHVTLQCETVTGALVAADPARMSQLLDNLTNNAIKFTPAGGSVHLSVMRKDDEVVVAVTDTGIGIPLDEQSRLFRRFFRSRLATEQAIAGTGIGLAIVKEIADAHGATIAVESVEGEGTTFRLAMPMIVSFSTTS